MGGKQRPLGSPSKIIAVADAAKLPLPGDGGRSTVGALLLSIRALPLFVDDR